MYLTLLRLRKQNKDLTSLEYIVRMLVIAYLITLIFQPLYNIFEVDLEIKGDDLFNFNIYINNNSLIKKIGLLVIDLAIFTPIIESIIFQIIPINIYLKLEETYKLEGQIEIYIIFGLSILFGLAHYPNSASIIKVIHSFFIGLILNNAYFDIYRNRNESPGLIVIIIHGIYNILIPLLLLIINIIVGILF